MGAREHVYLVYDRSRDLHKVGVSVDPVRRLRQLQTGNGELLGLVASYLTQHARQVESFLHRFYAQGNTIGEWFNLDAGEPLRFLERCKFFDDFQGRRQPDYQLEDF